MAKQERFIQVGVTALRDPVTREFLPAVPLFIRAEDAEECAEEKLVEDIGKLMAMRMREYKTKCEAAGLTI